MVFKDSHNIALYNWRLRSEKCGNSPEVRLESAKQELNMRLEEIKRRKKLQKKLLMVVYVIAAVFSFFQGMGFVAVLLMHFAAFAYGNYCFIAKCEMYAYETALQHWEAEGRPTGWPIT